MAESICGLDCGQCGWKGSCGGCAVTGGRPFGGECMLAACCRGKGLERCGDCPERPCSLKAQLIREFNALGIEDMKEVTDLNALKGSFVNLEYSLASGQRIKFWDDGRIYLGNQLCKRDSDRCYGLTADEEHLLVCEYGEAGWDPEIIVYQKRKKQP